MTSNNEEASVNMLVRDEYQMLNLSQTCEAETEESRGTSSKGKRKMNSRSKVWDFFKKVKYSDPLSGETVDKAQCIFCKSHLSADTKSSGPSELFHHVKICTKNPANSQETTLAYSTSETQDDQYGGILKNWKFDQEEFRKSLAYMVIVDELPFNFVERAGFQHFIQTACPSFSIPTRWTLIKDCLMVYEDERSKLKSFLEKSAHRVCLTTGTWTSVQQINYLCLTAHFIDDSWTMHKRILNFVPIESQRGEDIGLVIENCLRDWEIRNVFTITMDNATSNKKAIAYLKKKLAVHHGGCILGGKYLHMRCIAHIINLVVVDGLKCMHNSVSRIRNAVNYVRQSPSKWEKFKECISIEKIDSKSHVILDVPTRWNSTYTMLESAVKFEGAFERLDIIDPFFRLELCSKNKNTDSDGDNGSDIHEECDGVPNKSDWENARRFVKFLRHFYTLTVKVSGFRYVTSNCFFTEISDVLYLLEEWQQDEDVELATMAVRMKRKYDKYWGNVRKMNMIIYIAVVLDPRYKLDFLQWIFSEIFKAKDSQDEVVDLGEAVKIALYEMFNEYKRIYENDHVVVRGTGAAISASRSDINEGIGDAEGSSKLVSLFMMHKARARIEENRTELDTYLKEANESMGDEFDILSWWRMHSSRFPILSQMARDVLAVPISTFASESAFSTSGRVLDAFRSSLTPRIVQSLICAQDWIRGWKCTSQSNLCMEENLAEIEELEEDFINTSLNREHDLEEESRD